MIIFSFNITWTNLKTGEQKTNKYDSWSQDYLKAWDEALEMAKFFLEGIGTPWYIEKIESIPA